MIKIISEIIVSDTYGQAKTTSRSVYSATGSPLVHEFALTGNETRLIYNPTASTSADYQLAPATMVFLSDGNLDLEFTVNEGDASENVFTVRLVANIPFQLGSLLSYDVSAISGGATTFTTPTQSIEKIRVDNPDASAKKLKFIYQ